MDWISVEESLPDLEASVLLLVYGKATQGYLFEDYELNELTMGKTWYKGFQNEFSDDFLEYVDVTHWMPLPSPPNK
jgi:hypothetical protein